MTRDQKRLNDLEIQLAGLLSQRNRLRREVSQYEDYYHGEKVAASYSRWWLHNENKIREIRSKIKIIKKKIHESTLEIAHIGVEFPLCGSKASSYTRSDLSAKEYLLFAKGSDRRYCKRCINIIKSRENGKRKAKRHSKKKSVK